MGRVKSELFDWELDEAEHEEAMRDPEMTEWQRENFKKSVEQQIKEKEESDDRKNYRDV